MRLARIRWSLGAAAGGVYALVGGAGAWNSGPAGDGFWCLALGLLGLYATTTFMWAGRDVRWMRASAALAGPAIRMAELVLLALFLFFVAWALLFAVLSKT